MPVVRRLQSAKPGLIHRLALSLNPHFEKFQVLTEGETASLAELHASRPFLGYCNRDVQEEALKIFHPPLTLPEEDFGLTKPFLIQWCLGERGVKVLEIALPGLVELHERCLGLVQASATVATCPEDDRGQRNRQQDLPHDGSL